MKTKNLKKIGKAISVFLAAATCAVLFPLQLAEAWEIPTATDWETLSRDNIKVRFFVGSDAHIGRFSGESDKLANALDAFYTIDPDMDAVVLDGDNTNSGSLLEYSILLGIVNSSDVDSDKVQYCMGNHEFYGHLTPALAISTFKVYTKQKPNRVIKIGAEGNGNGGITIITIGASTSSGDYTEQYDFLKASLEEAASEDPTAPIFVMGHHSIKDTAYVSDEWHGSYGEGTDEDMVELMAQYPQVIHISGHSHSTVDDARSIDQSAGFTCIQDSTISAYFENESGKILSDGSHSTKPEGDGDASQALMIEVDNNNKVTIRRMDLTSGQYLYDTEPWVIDTPTLVSGDDFTYTDSRAAESKAPYFAYDALISITDTDTDCVTFSFSQALSADTGSVVVGDSNVDMVHAYKIKVTNMKTGKTVDDTAYSRNYWLRWSDYYKGTHAEELTQTINGLEANTKYKIELWALTSFETESSNSLTSTFTTAGTGSVQSILDVDFVNKTAADTSSIVHRAYTFGNPKISYSSVLGKNIAAFDGKDDAFAYNLTASDYDSIETSFSMECMFKLNSYEKGDIFMNCDSSGFGYELSGDGQTLEFWAHLGGKYQILSVDLSDIKSDWIHAVTTYDGSVIKIYINGKIAKMLSTSGTLDIPSDSSKWLMIGADTSGSGGVQLPSACSVSTARLFCGVLSAKDVALMYAEDTKDMTDDTSSDDSSDDAASEDASGGTASGDSSHDDATANPSGDISDIFSDVAGHWAETAIRYVSEKGLFNGVTVSTFVPDSTMTRGMFATVLWRLEGKPDAGSAQIFTDVTSDSWYAKGIRWAYNNSVVSGTGSGFSPDESVTREQLITMLYRYANYRTLDAANSGSIASFSDVAKVSDWAAVSMKWAVAEGLITGRADGNLSPKGTATRAEVATILMRFCENVMGTQQ
ncbi:MAG: hypothetical protein EOM14_03955 [Clostridia bacterium]|nr:hypothetical protein [Clostridia bacterium]